MRVCDCGNLGGWDGCVLMLWGLRMGVEVMGTRSIALIMRFGLAMGYRGCSSEVKGLLLLMILAVKLLPRVELFEYAFPH